MRTFSKLSRLFALVLLTGAVACYDRVPLGMAVPAPETRIIASLTDVGADKMAGKIGLAATEIEGIVQSATDTAWNIRLIRVDQRGGGSSLWSREIVSFPRYALNDPRTKVLNKKKSWMFAGAITVGAILAGGIFSGAFSPEEERGFPIQPPALRAP